MPTLDEFRKQAVPIYLASEYWYCAAKIFHLSKLGQVSSEQKQVGLEKHEVKAIEGLQSLEGRITPVMPESVEQLKELMFQQVTHAINEKTILSNSEKTTLYLGILSELNCIGKPDLVDCTDGIHPIVVERKFTKQAPNEPWLDHLVQAQLYMMTLQELGFPSVKSRIEYWGREDNQLLRTFELEPEDKLKEQAIQGIENTSQILRGSNELIPTKNPNKCRVCEYIVLCRWRADIPEYQPPYFLDIETNLEGTLVWCIGIFDPVEARFTQFFLEPEADESSILRDSIQLFSKRPSSRIMSFSASAFERRIIRKRLEANDLDVGISKRIVDLHPILRARLREKILGGLKEFSSKYGYMFMYEGMDGLQAALLYDEYKSNKKRSIKNKLLDYNRDDVIALVYLAMKMPDAFDFKRSQLGIRDEDNELLKSFYESSNLIIRRNYRRRGGSNIELRFRCKDEEERSLLSSILEQSGFSPRLGMDKKTWLIRMYGYTQVSDFLSMLGDNLDKRMASCTLNEK